MTTYIALNLNHHIKHGWIYKYTEFCKKDVFWVLSYEFQLSKQIPTDRWKTKQDRTMNYFAYL